MEKQLNIEDLNKDLDFFNHSTFWFHAFKPAINGEQQQGDLYSEFCNKDRIIELCERFNGQGIICIAINERESNKTKAEDVKIVQTLLFDIDVRKELKENFVSSEVHHNHAIHISLNKIKPFLEQKNFDVDMIKDSGNGCQLYCKVKISVATKESKEMFHSKIMILEKELQKNFNDDIISVDFITKDLNRRVKLAGTINKKDTMQREDRVAKVIYLNQDIDINKNNVAFEKLETSQLEVQNPKEIKKTKKPKTDNSRSATEYRHLCKLLFQGYSKEDIYEQMNAFTKWKEAGMAYKDFTFEKALKFVREKQSDDGQRTIFKYAINVEDFCKIQPFFYDKGNIFWLWNKEKFKWEMSDEVDIMNLLDSELGFDNKTIGSKVKMNYMEALKRIGRKNRPKDYPVTWIQFKDRVVDFETGDIFQATYEYFNTNPIPHEIGETEDTPTIDNIFKDWVGEKYVQLLYEIIAYCCLTDYPIHRIFCFIGSGSNGKSKFLELLTRFIGEENRTTTDLDLLVKSNFERAKLYKKNICVIAEGNFSTLSRTALLKGLSGQDPIGFEFKNKTPFTDKNYAKILIATNTLPTTTDRTRGFYRRWTIIPFFNEFTEKKDILKEIPEIEFKNLAKKSIGVIKHLLQNRAFTNEGSIEDREKMYEEHSNPLNKFLELHTSNEPNSYIFKYDFRDRFLAWLKNNGKRIWSEREISLELQESFESRRIEIEPGKRYNAWIGLSWKLKSNDNDNNNDSSVRLVRDKTCESTCESPHQSIKEGGEKGEEVERNEGITEYKQGDMSDIPDRILAFIKPEESWQNCLNYCISKGMTIQESENLLNKWLKEGLIFEPRAGYLKSLH